MPEVLSALVFGMIVGGTLGSISGFLLVAHVNRPRIPKFETETLVMRDFDKEESCDCGYVHRHVVGVKYFIDNAEVSEKDFTHMLNRTYTQEELGHVKY